MKYMTHFYERNITDIKYEYTEHLKDILTPLLYEGIYSLYKVSLDKHKKANNTPGSHALFQQCLKDLKHMSNTSLETETNRIKAKSNCAESFDNIIKSVIKSYIVLLTYNSNDNKVKIVDKRYHERIDINTFIHKCYMACAANLFYCPELFRLADESLEFRKNQRLVLEIIRGSIRSAIMNMLPMQLLTKEYLSNDYIRHETDNNPLSSDISVTGLIVDDSMTGGNENTFPDSRNDVTFPDSRNEESYVNINTSELLRSSETVNSTTIQTEQSSNVETQKQQDLSKIAVISTIDNIQNDLDAINDDGVVNAYKEISARSESVFMKTEPKIKMINAVVDSKAKQMLDKEIIKFNEKHNLQQSSALLSVSSSSEEHDIESDDENNSDA